MPFAPLRLGVKFAPLRLCVKILPAIGSAGKFQRVKPLKDISN
jgi:hypothetical protein